MCSQVYNSLINPRTLEHEFDPSGGSLGRAFGCNYKGYPYHAPTIGITPEMMDLSGYNQFVLNGTNWFPIYGPDGSPTTIRWRAWTREENGRHYCIVFEDFIL
jgi:hypothetical protein